MNAKGEELLVVSCTNEKSKRRMKEDQDEKRGKETELGLSGECRES